MNAPGKQLLAGASLTDQEDSCASRCGHALRETDRIAQRAALTDDRLESKNGRRWGGRAELGECQGQPLEDKRAASFSARRSSIRLAAGPRSSIGSAHDLPIHVRRSARKPVART